MSFGARQGRLSFLGPEWHFGKNMCCWADWLTDWLYLHNKSLDINSDIENYNVQDRKE